MAGLVKFGTGLALAALLPLTGAIAQTAPQLSPRSLNVDGFNYETELTALFLGDFAHARIEPDSWRFSAVLSGYIDGFARLCPSFLPPNRVEIMESRCTEQTVTRNGYGMQIGAAVCSRYESFGTGRYADPQLLSLSGRLQARLIPGFVAGSLGLGGGDGMGTSRQMVDTMLSLGSDMTDLFQKNSCGSAGIKRLQANIVRFAEGQTPLRLASGATLTTLRAPTAGPFRDSDYARLIDALIAENAQGWMMNRYVPGSASGVEVGSRDAAGRPAQISASYQFSGFSGQSAGTVSLTFSDGLPECLYFFDAPQTCRLPSRRVITAYEKGEYRR